MTMSMDSGSTIAVIGAGAWGSALGIHLARVGHQVHLWTHSPEQAQALQTQRENRRYLKGVHFPQNITVTSDLTQALEQAVGVLVVVPSHVFRATLQQMRALLQGREVHFAWATKGFEPESASLLHQVAEEELGGSQTVAVLSGPTFADEVARGLPTAMVSASKDEAESAFWASMFHYDHFRMYTQHDVVGVEVGGAYKNIMAIATGLSDGLRLGANARAALIARGMAEMMRLGQALGGQPETLMGLAGLGDLVLTCTDDLSRNRRFGLQLAQNPGTVDEVITAIGQVVEGVKAVMAVKRIAGRHQLDLPIMEQVYRIVTNACTPQEAVEELMAREGRSEDG
ncbi:NAD(P)-dependent glycerol-3-phosphate dehydrogenase [Thiomicrorhabdus sp. zzn3]|nr:NAD(P)-dependent glycerol-3-phosphate dehydrogenase [Thiomicrorhabdus sp. zzn3]MDG6778583.1 NAD(P)-dependent glycerol-3-phosphate dehydrogenase [Thiomicrorhabdus sp. zzn3]